MTWWGESGATAGTATGGGGVPKSGSWAGVTARETGAISGTPPYPSVTSTTTAIALSPAAQPVKRP